MNKFFQYLGIQRYPSRLPELMNGAQALGEKVNTFVLSDADSATACHLGADHVWLLSGKPEDRMVEDYADAMAETIRQHSEGGGAAAEYTSGQAVSGKAGLSLVGCSLK
jgi:electron transfer flavoprotein alpha subunit